MQTVTRPMAKSHKNNTFVLWPLFLPSLDTYNVLKKFLSRTLVNLQKGGLLGLLGQIKSRILVSRILFFFFLALHYYPKETLHLNSTSHFFCLSFCPYTNMRSCEHRERWWPLPSQEKRLQDETTPTDTMIFNSQYLELCEINFCSLPPSL